MTARLIILCVLSASFTMGAGAQDRSQATTPPPTSDAAQSPAPHPARIRVSDRVAAAQLIHQVQPIYPPDAKAAQVQGTVVLHVIIARDGSVQKLDTISGPPMLIQAASDAAHQWRYRPTKLNGEPVEVDTTINVVFALDKHGRLKPQPKTPR